ncbi:MAG TPA: S1 RNA-binding domain-containing protein [Clostridia bacterium]|nr:S1 RNA-binding domain-containing protein [Clostridia bacterium]
MAVEVGSIVEGKVTGITKFGAFVELPGGKTGMVHISEIAATYVKEIRDFLQENQVVSVKVIAITPEGKVNLSIKRAMEQVPRSTNVGARPSHQPHRTAPSPRRAGPGNDIDFSRQGNAPQNFEDMLNRFKQTSDDKMSDIRRNLDSKRGSAGPKRHTK